VCCVCLEQVVVLYSRDVVCSVFGAGRVAIQKKCVLCVFGACSVGVQ